MDSFTTRAFRGNPAGVYVLEAERGADWMQNVAKEMNLSETTFVLPSSTATRRVRFFTPAAEIPLAGHPTIGTWWYLAESGALQLNPNGTTRVTQETGAGVHEKYLALAEKLEAEMGHFLLSTESRFA